MPFSPTLASYIAPTLTNDPIIRHLVNLIPHLSVSSRKAILTLCQAGLSSEEHIPSTEAIDNAITEVISMHQDKIEVTRRDLFEIIFRCSESHVYRSFISMVLRNERLDRYSGAEQVLEEGFLKEFWASQSKRDEEIRISYQCLDLDNYHPADYTIYYPMTPWWNKKAKGFVHRFAQRVEKLGIIFPVVQRKKNMSVDTCRNLFEDGYRSDRNWRDFRTLDLELHKVKTGREIQGNCEMRMAWKFNDLKNRLYYCIGGSNHWRSRHVKPIAVAMMECIDSSRLERRQRPEDIEFYTSPDDWIAIWDMISFTTTLSELKHFLWYIAKNMEEDIRCRQQPLSLLDYAEGIIHKPIYEVLLEYNDGENFEAPFSIWRVCDKIYSSFDDTEVYHQQNSGMLGVPGNIGFSTAFHAFHAEAAIIEGSGCGVGDDMLGATTQDPRDFLIPHMKLIGDIQTTKAEIFPPMDEGDYPQVWKFLKRRFQRSFHGISLDYLFSFPALAYVFEISDEYHTVDLGDFEDRVYKFVTQVGVFLWDIQAVGWRAPEEVELIDGVLRRCYRHLGLPLNGALPGQGRNSKSGARMEYAIPPLMFDYTSFDWAEWLWDNAPEKLVLLPMSVGEPDIPPYEKDLCFHAGEGSMLNVLEDIGCIKKLRTLKEWVEVNETNRRVFRKFIRGSPNVIRCQYIAEPPSWFDDVFTCKVYAVRDFV